MTKSDPSREMRLAARLRENLHRRKAQARAQPDADAQPPETESPPPLSKAPADR